MKAGRAADGKYDYQATLVKNETTQFGQDRDAVAEEWAAWANRQGSPVSDRGPVLAGHWPLITGDWSPATRSIRLATRPQDRCEQPGEPATAWRWSRPG